MAKASFFVNDIRVRRKGDFLVLEARKQCQHGTVFDEVFLTVPAKLAHLFTEIDQGGNISDCDKTALKFERFKFSTDN